MAVNTCLITSPNYLFPFTELSIRPNCFYTDWKDIFFSINIADRGCGSLQLQRSLSRRSGSGSDNWASCLRSKIVRACGLEEFSCSLGTLGFILGGPVNSSDLVGSSISLGWSLHLGIGRDARRKLHAAAITSECTLTESTILGLAEPFPFGGR